MTREIRRENRVRSLVEHLHRYTFNVCSRLSSDVQAKIKKPNLFANIPKNESEYEVAVRTFLRIATEKKLTVLGIRTDYKTDGDYETEKTQLLLMDDKKQKFVLTISKSEDAIEWNLSPYACFSEKKPLHEESSVPTFFGDDIDDRLERILREEIDRSNFSEVVKAHIKESDASWNSIINMDAEKASFAARMKRCRSKPSADFESPMPEDIREEFLTEEEVDMPDLRDLRKLINKILFPDKNKEK